jgi:hypothetical protein
MTTKDIHARATRLKAAVRTRNFFEYACSTFVVLAMAWIALLIPEPIVRLGALLIALGAIFVSCQLFVRGRIREPKCKQPREISTAEYRSELERQCVALLSVWRWYLLPFVPGIVVFVLGVAFAPSAAMPILESISLSVRGLGFAGIVLGFVWLLNLLAARALQADVKRLDAAAPK